MLMSGQEYLDSLRDGRKVYVGKELVEDVTTHPAFRNAAHSVFEFDRGLEVVVGVAWIDGALELPGYVFGGTVG